MYELKLNETLSISETSDTGFSQSTTIRRVPGGWIYYTETHQYEEVYDTGCSVTSSESQVFVTFNTEFDNN